MFSQSQEALRLSLRDPSISGFERLTSDTFSKLKKISLVCRDSIMTWEVILPEQPLVFSPLTQCYSSPPSLGFPTEQRTSPEALSISAQQECAEVTDCPNDAVSLQSPA